MLSSRLEECQAEQQAVSGQLTDANKTNRKVYSSFFDTIGQVLTMWFKLKLIIGNLIIMLVNQVLACNVAELS